MLKKTLVTAGLVAALASPALAVDEQLPINAIDVRAATDNMAGANGFDLHPSITADLKNAVWAELDNKKPDDASAYSLDIILSALRVDDSVVLPEDGRFNYMEALVEVREYGTTDPMTTFPVLVRAMKGDAPAGAYVVDPAASDYYGAMLAGFAKGVEREMVEIPNVNPTNQTPGEASN